MIAVWLALVVGGLALLALDLRGRLTVHSRVGLWRSIGVAAAAGPGLAPIIAARWHLLIYEGSAFPAVGLAYLSAFALFFVGAMDWHDRRQVSLTLRRLAYAGLLTLSALPSFVLLPFTLFVFLAGAGLVRQSSEVGHSA